MITAARGGCVITYSCGVRSEMLFNNNLAPTIMRANGFVSTIASRREGKQPLASYLTAAAVTKLRAFTSPRREFFSIGLRGFSYIVLFWRGCLFCVEIQSIVCFSSLLDRTLVRKLVVMFGIPRMMRFDLCEMYFLFNLHIFKWSAVAGAKMKKSCKSWKALENWHSFKIGILSKLDSI